MMDADLQVRTAAGILIWRWIRRNFKTAAEYACELCDDDKTTFDGSELRP